MGRFIFMGALVACATLGFSHVAAAHEGGGDRQRMEWRRGEARRDMRMYRWHEMEEAREREALHRRHCAMVPVIIVPPPPPRYIWPHGHHRVR